MSLRRSKRLAAGKTSHLTDDFVSDQIATANDPRVSALGTGPRHLQKQLSANPEVRFDDATVAGDSSPSSQPASAPPDFSSAASTNEDHRLLELHLKNGPCSLDIKAGAPDPARAFKRYPQLPTHSDSTRSLGDLKAHRNPPSRPRRHLPLYSPPATTQILPHQVHPPPPPPHQRRPRFLASSTTRDHHPNSAASSTFQTWLNSSSRFPPCQASNCLRSQRFHTASSRPLQPQHPRVASPPDRLSWPSHLRILRIRLARGVFFPIPSLVLIQQPRICQSAAQILSGLTSTRNALLEPRAALRVQPTLHTPHRFFPPDRPELPRQMSGRRRPQLPPGDIRWWRNS